jgi:hypothetical protein
MRIALKTLTREKKAPIVESIKSTFDKQVQQVAKTEETLYYKKPTESFIWINPEYDETSSEFAPDKTLKEWCDIKGISISDLSNYNPDSEHIATTPNVSGITRVRLPKVSNATDICIITLGEYIKLIKNKLDYVSQTRLYYKKHEGFLPEGIPQREKDMSGDTSYYSKLSCAPEHIDKLKQYIKMNFRTDKVKWLI